MNKRLKNLLTFTIVTATVPVLLFLILNSLFPLQIRLSYSQTVISDNGSVLHAYLNKDEKWRMMAELHEISPQLKKAFLFKEDKLFYYHPGVNPFSICRAGYNNIVKRQKTSGASTITMQLARLLHPARRTYANKTVEIFRALQLEWNYSKEEILCMYLNLVPYGGNIEGVKAASMLYYGRKPEMLSLAQVVTLTIIPNRPTSLKPGKNNQLLQKERDKWLVRLKEGGIFTEEEAAGAISELLTTRRMEAPREAPHFSRMMAGRNPGTPIIKTSLNENLQKRTENIASNYLQRIRLLNIHNASVVVIDNTTRQVKAYLGSTDFHDETHSGQVDGVQAMRSPGSTLKPLVYAMAFENGLLTPKMIINDVPVNFAGYKPENFNSRFNGKVTAENALAFSLNVPAVKVLQQTGLPAFTDMLRRAGFSKASESASRMGLSMVLGGCGVSLFELAGLYAAIANGGVYENLKCNVSDTSGSRVRLLSENASYLISEILTQPVRPDLPNQYESSLHVPRVAWKTGTSYGRRDAWSIGYNKKYTIAVWVGNFDGTGVPELTGADIATPLLFNLFNSIDYNSSAGWFAPPAGLDFRLVCNESGLPPGEGCTDIISDYFIPGVSAFRKCTHLKEVFVSASGQNSYCMACLPEAGYKKMKFANLEPELLAYYRGEHIDFASMPPHNPSCTRVFTDTPPRITSPVNDKEYLVQKDQGEELELKCQVPDDVSHVYWYINNLFYKKALPTEQVFFKPEKGSVKISCSDDQGRNGDCLIRVLYY